MKKNKHNQSPRIEFPYYLHKRIAELVLDGLAYNTQVKKKVYPKEDREIHDILCDYYNEKRTFNVYDSKKAFNEKLKELEKMTPEELIREINGLLQGQDVLYVI